MRFNSGLNGWFNSHKSNNMIYYINKRNNRKHDTLNKCRTSWQCIASIHYKNLKHNGDGGNIPHHKRPIILHGEKQSSFTKIRNMTEMFIITIAVSHTTGSPGLLNQTTKQNKMHLNRKERSETFTICIWHDNLCRKPENLQEKKC